MIITTHLIKIKGNFNTHIWNEASLRNYVNEKIVELESTFHADIEQFKIYNKNQIDVWILIQGLPSEVSQLIVDKWAKNHITEKGLFVEEVKTEIINSMIDPKPPFIMLNRKEKMTNKSRYIIVELPEKVSKIWEFKFKLFLEKSKAWYYETKYMNQISMNEMELKLKSEEHKQN